MGVGPGLLGAGGTGSGGSPEKGCDRCLQAQLTRPVSRAERGPCPGSCHCLSAALGPSDGARTGRGAWRKEPASPHGNSRWACRLASRAVVRGSRSSSGRCVPRGLTEGGVRCRLPDPRWKPCRSPFSVVPTSLNTFPHGGAGGQSWRWAQGTPRGKASLKLNPWVA